MFCTIFNFQTRSRGGEKDEEVQISTEYKKFQILLFYILHNDMFSCFSCFHICPRKIQSGSLSQEIQELMLCTIRCEVIFIIRKQNGQKAAD